MNAKDKKIITLNAMQLYWKKNDEISLYKLCKIFYSTSKSKRVKTGFDCKNFISFYKSVQKFNKNSPSPLLINPNNIKILEETDEFMNNYNAY